MDFYYYYRNSGLNRNGIAMFNKKNLRRSFTFFPPIYLEQDGRGVGMRSVEDVLPSASSRYPYSFVSFSY